MTNFVPNKLITVDDRKQKNRRKERDYEKLPNMTTNITTEILSSKKIYFDNLAEKVCHPKLSRKRYWSIFKSFTSWKKVAIIAALLINDHSGINFNEKSNHFKDFFANQCSLINNHNKLPLNRASTTISLLRSVNIK